jgi:hypothetical protein
VQEINDIHKYDGNEKHEWVIRVSAIYAKYMWLVCGVFEIFLLQEVLATENAEIFTFKSNSMKQNPS